MCTKHSKELKVFAGVAGSGKTSMMGIFSHCSQEMLETALSEEDIQYIAQRYSQGAWIQLNYIGLDTLEEHLFRIANRVTKGGTNIDPHDVKSQFDCRFESLTQVLPFCNEVFFYDNDNGFRCVGHYRDTMTVEKDPGLWFLEYLIRFYIQTHSDFTDDEKIQLAGHYILEKYRQAFTALA